VRYRIPYKLSGPTARNKARVAYYLLRRPLQTQSDVVPERDSKAIDIEAPSLAAAAKALTAAVLPDDPRPVRATSWIKHFAVGD
jgi:hypothetical protein